MTAAYKNWSEKLNKTLLNDRLEGVQPIGLRPAGLDDTDLLQAPSPPLPQSELTAVISSHRTEVKQAFQLRKELGKPAEPGAKGTVRHVSSYDDSKMAKFEADMLKRFGDKVRSPRRQQTTRATQPAHKIASSGSLLPHRWAPQKGASGQAACASSRKRTPRNSAARTSSSTRRTSWPRSPSTRPHSRCRNSSSSPSSTEGMPTRLARHLLRRPHATRMPLTWRRSTLRGAVCCTRALSTTWGPPAWKRARWTRRARDCGPPP